MLTAERLREVLYYNPETGVFTWREKCARKVVKGSRAGCVNGAGYRQIRIAGAVYAEHRLAVLYMTGQWPALQVDHRNMNRADNRWSNLREASNEQNSRNRRPCRGFVEVGGKYLARIRIGGRRVGLGVYSSQGAAAAAYALASYLYFGEFSNG